MLSLSTNVRDNLKHSTWLAASWAWIEEFCGHAAVAFLTASFVWNGLKLYNPGIAAAAPGLDTFFAAALFVALDAAGLASNTLADQAEGKENYAGADKMRRIGRLLLILMIATISLAAIQFKFHLSGMLTDVIDTILFIARAIIAVFYTTASRQLHRFLQGQEAKGETEIEELRARLAELEKELQARRAEIETVVNGRQLLASENEKLKMKILEMARQVSITEEDTGEPENITHLPPKRISAPAAAGSENISTFPKIKRITAAAGAGQGSKTEKTVLFIQELLATGAKVSDIRIEDLTTALKVSNGTAHKALKQFR